MDIKTGICSDDFGPLLTCEERHVFGSFVISCILRMQSRQHQSSKNYQKNL